MADKELQQAIDQALIAIAKSELKLYANSDHTVEEMAEFLRANIASNPKQYRSDEMREPPEVSFAAMTTILGELFKRQQLDQHSKMVQREHQEMLELLYEAYNAFSDPSNKDRHKATEAVARVLGFRSRKKQKSAEYFEEFEELRACGVGVDDAYKTLAVKYTLSKDAIRKGIKREQEKRSKQ